MEREIFPEALDDYTGIWAIAFAAEGEMPDASEEEIRGVALGFVEDVLSRGLMTGGFARGRRFESLGLDASETMERVRREWEDLGGRRPDVGEGIWFDLTPEGRDYARRLDAAA